MIMPSKHIELSESLIGLGAYVIKVLSMPMTIDSCWVELNKRYIDTGAIKKRHSFDNFVLAIDVLFALGILDFNKGGELINVLNEIK